MLQANEVYLLVFLILNGLYTFIGDIGTGQVDVRSLKLTREEGQRFLKDGA